jgi:hypothetical protein
MHHVLYNGIRPFHGAIPAFLNIPYKPIRTAIDARINRSKPILMSGYLLKETKIAYKVSY